MHLPPSPPSQLMCPPWVPLLGTAARRSAATRANSLRFLSITSMAATDLPSPYDQLACTILDRELQETAYEIFIAVCRSTGSKPLTCIPQSECTPPSVDCSPSSLASSSPLSSSLSLQRSAHLNNGQQDEEGPRNQVLKEEPWQGEGRERWRRKGGRWQAGGGRREADSGDREAAVRR